MVVSETNLLANGARAALIKQAVRRTVHDQARHQILECSGTPGQQDSKSTDTR